MRLSAHFTDVEFRCRHCGQVKINPTLVAHLEILRALVGEPLRVVSGYRCPTHNRAVGGAARSKHVLGDAADLVYGYATVGQARSAGFTGIGRKGPYATHVDVRRGHRAEWSYGG